MFEKLVKEIQDRLIQSTILGVLWTWRYFTVTLRTTGLEALDLAEVSTPAVPNAVLGIMAPLHVTCMCIFLTYTATLNTFNYLKGTPDGEYPTFQ